MHRSKRLVSSSQPLFVFATIVLFLTTGLAQSTENTLYTFTGGADGNAPKAGVIFGPDGNLYGATQYGGAFQDGTIYKMIQNSDGSWSENVIYSFTDVNDGAGPIGPLTFDVAGNIYGTTAFGAPYGTVFKLSPNSDGSWSATLLYGFTGGANGGYPLTGVTLDKAGNLYGTTSATFTASGIAYKLSPTSNGSWTETVLYNFGNTLSGEAPSTGLVLDAAGNLYGATSGGGTFGAGTIYELSPNSDGSWTESTLYTFTGKTDGKGPGVLLIDKSGTLYGGTMSGGIKNSNSCYTGCGTIFALSRSKSGTWSFARIFAFNSTTGLWANELVMDGSGNLFGSTLEGGTGDGVAFELQRASVGYRWTYASLYNFGGGNNIGAEPVIGAVRSGNAYGITMGSTAFCNCGSVFELTP